MVYSINFTKNAIRQLSKVPEPYYENIKLAIRELAVNPRPSGCKKLQGLAGYRIRVGTYRVIYEIFDNELLIDIIAIGHRREIYR
ncbi:MAG: type II toxin-antitoxin system RelE/ParE family toxin [Paludibacter sp.]|jgi:mRNA interferase RelE/StbE|nr:type II toxin-antitoxin system RelE/ParE family toxin [Paludibacter sp.]